MKQLTAHRIGQPAIARHERALVPGSVAVSASYPAAWRAGSTSMVSMVPCTFDLTTGVNRTGFDLGTAKHRTRWPSEPPR
ncbi:MAG TPA: hypothetical protein VK866_03415 [Acidimicrobiales bacterium]|nr:hypothetical protein [Acidimicrobiales bacterium]